MNLPQLYGPWDFLIWDMLMVMLAFLAGMIIGRYMRSGESFGRGYHAGYEVGFTKGHEARYDLECD